MSRDVEQPVNALDEDDVGSFIPSNLTVWRFEQISKRVVFKLIPIMKGITGVAKT